MKKTILLAGLTVSMLLGGVHVTEASAFENERVSSYSDHESIRMNGSVDPSPIVNERYLKGNAVVTWNDYGYHYSDHESIQMKKDGVIDSDVIYLPVNKSIDSTFDPNVLSDHESISTK